MVTTLAFVAAVALGEKHPKRSDPTYVGYFHVRAFVRRFRRYDLAVVAHRRERVPVRLRRGTVVVPRGLRLRPDMLVSIDGFFVRGTFLADRVSLIER